MDKSILLKQMFQTFSDSFLNRESGRVLSKNYERQIDSYSKLFKAAESLDDEEAKRQLICARCLISATRSLLYKGYCDENIPAIEKELSFLKPIFSGRRMTAADLSLLVDRRINSLVPKKSDEMVDAILFMYISLAPPKTQNEERELERSLL